MSGIMTEWRRCRLALLCAVGISPIYAADLLVFLPGEVPKAQIQAEISKSAGGLAVEVFTNIRDFEKQREAEPKAAIVAPGALVQLTGGYDVAMNGVNGNAVGEKYLIVTANDAVQLGNLPDKKVGVWNIFGRKNVEPFFQNYFGLKISKLKTVNKKEDLLTLLGIDMADAILISQSDFNQLKKSSDVKLRVLAESKSPVPFPVVAIPKGGNAGAVKGLSGVSKGLLQKFDFDAWRAK